MRSLWTGSISFGLINIPVKMYTASKERTLDLDMLHKKDLSPIRYARICKATGEEVPFQDIVKGYEYQKGDYVVLDEEDLKKVNVKKTQTIDVNDFVEEKEIDPMLFEKPYYLEPDKGGAKAYVLLREALKKSKKVAVVKYVLRTKENLGILIVKDELLVLTQIRYQQEVVSPEDVKVPEKVDATKKEIDMALRLIDQLTDSFDASKYKDTYRDEIEAMIEKKAKGKKTVSKKTGKPTPTKVPDLMESLRKSLEMQKKGKSHAVYAG